MRLPLTDRCLLLSLLFSFIPDMYQVPKKIITLLMALACLLTANGQEIREYMDLQSHATMSFPHPIFKPGLTYFDTDTPKLSYNHTLTNVNYANYWEDNAGARIIINGAMPQEYFVTPKRARELVLEQLEYVNAFAEAHADKFVVAFTPQQVRHYVTTTDKTVIIHSIEGAEKIVHSQEDACFWADQGISFMTLIHLMNNRYGGAATLPEVPTMVINFKDAIRSVFHPGTKGLTKQGEDAIMWLTNAGIMTDITHMSPQTRADALAFMQEKGIPPLSTHEGFQPIQNHTRALSPEQVVLIYQLGGLVSLAVSLEEYNPYEYYRKKLEALPNHCPGSIDSYQFTYQVLDSFIRSSAGIMLNKVGLHWDDLTEQQKVLLSIGFQTDFNGWTSHARPRVGPDGCYPMEPGKEYNPIEVQGLAHPGLLADHWQYLEDEGVDLDPIKRSSERFLQMWELFLSKRTCHK